MTNEGSVLGEEGRKSDIRSKGRERERMVEEKQKDK